MATAVFLELRPAACDAIPQLDDTEQALQLLADTGDVTQPRVPKGDWKWSSPLGQLEPGAVSALLDELRSDR